MDPISTQFQNLKNYFIKTGKQDAQARSSVRLALADFNNCIKDITLKPNLIELTAVNKSAANELFLRKDEIKKQLPEWVTELQVR